MCLHSRKWRLCNLSLLAGPSVLFVEFITYIMSDQSVCCCSNAVSYIHISNDHGKCFVRVCGPCVRTVCFTFYCATDGTKKSVSHVCFIKWNFPLCVKASPFVLNVQSILWARSAVESSRFESSVDWIVCLSKLYGRNKWKLYLTLSLNGCYILTT
jgi:hypothetical protein